jgi:hypothetical protein
MEVERKVPDGKKKSKCFRKEKKIMEKLILWKKCFRVGVCALHTLGRHVVKHGQKKCKLQLKLLFGNKNVCGCRARA